MARRKEAVGIWERPDQLQVAQCASRGIRAWHRHRNPEGTGGLAPLRQLRLLQPASLGARDVRSELRGYGHQAASWRDQEQGARREEPQRQADERAGEDEDRKSVV